MPCWRVGGAVGCWRRAEVPYGVESILVRVDKLLELLGEYLDEPRRVKESKSFGGADCDGGSLGFALSNRSLRPEFTCWMLL